MPPIRLRDYRSERIADRLVGTFELSEKPDSRWIERFEECLAQLSDLGVAVVEQRVRAELPAGGEFRDVVRMVQQCIEAANRNGNGHRLRDVTR